MKKYNITVTGSISFPIEAESEEDAIALVENYIDNGEEMETLQDQIGADLLTAIGEVEDYVVEGWGEK